MEAISDPVQRRTFLKLMGASLALAGAGACTRQPLEKIVPYVRQPEHDRPGPAALLRDRDDHRRRRHRAARGKPTRDGRPRSKAIRTIPTASGRRDAFAQAAVLDLYDPDRARAVTNLGEIRPWPSFLAVLRNALAAQDAAAGRQLRILTETDHVADAGGPARRLFSRSTRKPSGISGMPRAPTTRGPERASRSASTCRPATPSSRPTSSSRSTPISCRAARAAFGTPASSRRADRRQQADRMNRLYAVETMPTTTGRAPITVSPVKPTDVETFARQLAATLGVLPAERRRRERVRARHAMGRRRVQGSAGAPRLEPGDRRRHAAGGGSRAGARDQPGARQRRPHRGLHRPDRSRADRPAAVDCAIWSAR